MKPIVDGSRSPGTESFQEEITFVRFFLILWGHRKWILLGTLLATFIGGLYAALARPVYSAQAILSVKSGDNRGGSTAQVLAQFGVGGGGGQGIGEMSIDKIRIILNGHELAEDLVAKNRLLPVLFPKLWDPAAGRWKLKSGQKPPTLRAGGEAVRKLMEVKTSQKEGTLTLGFHARDPKLAERLVQYYVVGLNEKLRYNVVRGAEASQRFLENQLGNTYDPALREIILNLIASEIQKKMLVSSNALEILEGPVVPMAPSKPNRKKIVLLSFFAGLFASMAGVVAWKVAAGFRTALVREGAAARGAA